jgi:peroxiredoxin
MKQPITIAPVPTALFGPMCGVSRLPRWIVQDAPNGGHQVVDTLFNMPVGETHRTDRAAREAVRDIKARYCGKAA